MSNNPLQKNSVIATPKVTSIHILKGGPGDIPSLPLEGRKHDACFTVSIPLLSEKKNPLGRAFEEQEGVD